MIRTAQIGMTALLLAALLAVPLRAGECDRVKGRSCTGDEKTPTDIDPAVFDASAFFDALVVRYRGLEEYHDSTQLTQVTRRAGEADVRQETRIECAILDDELVITTPTGQLTRTLGLALPLRGTGPMSELRRRYDLWLAPHMALRFCEEPLADLREGVDEGFTPCVAERVVRNERAMVHLKLRSGDGLSVICEAELDFYINKESMLIERIESVHHLPDGSDYITTLDITPSVPAVVG